MRKTLSADSDGPATAHQGRTSTGERAKVRMPPPPATVSWNVSSERFPDAFERYQESMADLYEVTDVPDQGRLDFVSRTCVTIFENGTIARGHSSGQTMRRSAAEIARSNLDPISIILNLSPVVGDCDGVDVRTEPWAVQFRDLARPSVSRVDVVDLVNMLIPREAAPVWMAEGDIHGVVLRAGTPAGRLMASHMMVFSETANDLTPAEGAAAIEAAFLISERAVGRLTEATSAQTQAIYRTVRHRATEVIARRLLDPALSVDAIAVEAGASRTTIYRAFARYGGIQRRIQSLRLDRARAALRRRVGRSPTVADIAWRHGFPSAAHFSRLYRERFGHPPGEVEPVSASAHRASAPAGSLIRHDVVLDWLRERTA